MNNRPYDKLWEEVSPAIEAKMEGIVALLRERMPGVSVESPSSIEGDEDNSVEALVSDAAGDPSINIAIKLVDAEYSGSGDAVGAAIRYEAIGINAQVLGSYSPENYTSGVFTTDAGELLDRLAGLDVGEVVSGLQTHLEDPALNQVTKRSPRPK